MSDHLDPQSDTARFAAHRELHRTVHPITLVSSQEAQMRIIEACMIAEEQLRDAVRHLHAILNSQRTATQSWQAEQEARQWLASIGSEAP